MDLILNPKEILFGMQCINIHMWLVFFQIQVHISMGTGIYNEYVNLGIEWPPGMCLFLIFFSFFSGCFFKPELFHIPNHVFSKINYF